MTQPKGSFQVLFTGKIVENTLFSNTNAAWLRYDTYVQCTCSTAQLSSGKFVKIMNLVPNWHISLEVIPSSYMSYLGNHLDPTRPNRNCFGQFRGILWNQTWDVHRESTLIMPHWRYLT